jgi:hypothetical protein
MRSFIICTVHQNITRAIKSRMRWVGDVEGAVEMGNEYKILVGKPEWKIHLEDLGVDERISE